MSLIIAIVLFVTIVKKKKAPKGRFLKWLREFLNFRSILISGIIKFVYLFLATLLTIGSIVVMFQGKDDTMLQAVTQQPVTPQSEAPQAGAQQPEVLQ